MVRNRIRRFLLLAIACAGWFCATRDEVSASETPGNSFAFAAPDEVLKGGRSGPGRALPEARLTPDMVSPDANPDTSGAESSSQPSDSDSGTAANRSPAQPRDPGASSRLIGSYFYLNHRGGAQLGQANPDTAFGMFYPVNVENGIWFALPQIAVNNDGNVGSGISFGRRWLAGPADRMFGAALSWDAYPNRAADITQQGVLSLETRGEAWDAYANGYLPVVNRTSFGSSASYGPVTYQGNNLVAGILREAETAMVGGDLQLARRLGENNLWGFGGWYHLEGGGETTDGFLTGVRGYLGDQVLLDGTLTYDKLFGTNVGFSATLFFGGSGQGRVSPRTAGQRMAEPLYRRDSTTQYQRQVATGSQVLTRGGNPLTVTHVNSSGAAGTGTITSPFGSLTSAAGSPTNLVLVHADSVFNGQQFMVQPGQQLLGEADGIPHFVLTDQMGSTQLPRATGGINAPVIQNSPGNAITLSSNSVVSGFQIQNAGGAGIFGNSPGSVLIDRVMVQGSAGPGVLLQVGGTDVMDATVRNSVFTGNAVPSSYQFAANAGAVLTLNLTTNEDSAGFNLQRDPNGFLRLNGLLGTGGFFNDDNGNVANNGNTTLGGPPNVIISGAGNQIQIVP